MASITLTPDLQKFPIGTSVDALATSRNGEAVGSALESKVVQANGTVTFTTLADGYYRARFGSQSFGFQVQSPAPLTSADADLGASLAGRTRVNATGVGLNGNAPVAKAAAIASPTAPSAAYVQAEAASAKAAIDAIRVALQNLGVTL